MQDIHEGNAEKDIKDILNNQLKLTDRGKQSKLDSVAGTCMWIGQFALDATIGKPEQVTCVTLSRTRCELVPAFFYFS